jgi:glucose dehydrogenase
VGHHDRRADLLTPGDLGQVGYANPMTYRTREGRQYVVIATGRGQGTRLMAFALSGAGLEENR